MKKQLIVVVHGVGVRDAGVVTDQLSAALSGDASARLRAGAPWVPHSSDDFFLHEDARFAKRGLLLTFSAHLRRFRRRDPAQPDVVTHERVVADYFWGDISGTGMGPLQVLIGLIKIILGLSHAVRENAVDVFPGATPRAIWMRRLARTAPLLIHGPIVAINLVLLAGVCLTMGVHIWTGAAFLPDQPEAHPIGTQLALGLGTLAVGWFGLRRAQVFLLRHLFSWLLVVGVLVLLLVGVEAVSWPILAPLKDGARAFLIAHVCDGLVLARCTIGTAGFALLGMQLMAVMMLCWAAVLVVALVIEGVGRVKGLFPDRGTVQPILQPAIALMTLLWLILMTAVWSIVLSAYQIIHSFGINLPKELNVDQVNASLRLVTPAVAALFVLAAVGLWLQGRKTRAFGGFSPADYLPQRDTLAERHRLIVGQALLWVLTLFTLAMFLAGVVTNLGVCRGISLESCAAFTGWMTETVPEVIAFVGLFSILLVWAGRHQMATMVAILTDILVYLNDYSWRSREAEMGLDPATKITPWKTRTMVETAFDMRQDQANVKQRYWLRKRIHSRLHVLMTTLIRDERPDEIVIVSHSQGTMIALDVIEARGRQWLDMLDSKVPLKLVTMGSPYIHLYNSYFPSMFPDLSQRPRLQRCCEGGLLAAWVNIFRVDDFVGTHIDTRRGEGLINQGRGWPQEEPVPANGHTNYWTDEKVFPALLKVLAF